jgi:hypothetical protein
MVTVGAYSNFPCLETLEKQRNATDRKGNG